MGNCKFKDFLERFSPLSKIHSDVTSKLWSAFRSAHFHAGEFGLGEFTEGGFMHIIIDEDAANKMHIQVRSEQIIREAIVNWVSELASGNF